MRKDAQSTRYFFSILVLLAAALAIPVAGAAPRSPALGTIGGKVFGSDGFAAAGARVTLQASDGRDPHTTLTNTQGRFWFPMLPAGLYDVRATYKGRSSEWRQNVSVGTGRQTTVTLHLRSKKPAPANTSRHL